MEGNPIAKSIIQRHGKLKADRAVFEGQWQEVVDYVLPNRLGFTTINETPGQRRMQKIFDATAPWANEQLAAQLHGMMTNPAQKWFILRTKNRSLMQDIEAALWLEDVQNIIYDVFNSPEANFNSQAHELYLDLGGFGTAVMLVEETPGEGPGVRYRTWFLGECVIAENRYGMVDTLYRKFKMTTRQAYQAWKDDIGEKMMKLYKTDPDQSVWIIHEVRPRNERDTARSDPKNMPFSSIYVWADESEILSESGFPKFPFLVPRWTKMAGETYGRSPAMSALPDIKMLNEMCKTTLKAAQKIVDPPLMVPDDGFILPLRTVPAGLNFYRMGLGENSMIRPLETKGNVNLGLEMEDRRRESILRAFYQDRFKLQKEKVEMTRAEALIRQQENLRNMSPISGRLEVEFLNEVIQRTFEAKQRQGALPPVPDVLKGQQLTVEYLSPISRAQKSSEAEAVERAFAMIAPMGQADPQIFDNFDGDMIARETPTWFGLPHKMMKSKEAVEQIRTGREERRQAEQQKIDEERDAANAAQIAKAQQ